MEQDAQKAVAYYRQGVESEESHAVACLGLCYEHGIGVEMDFSKAANLYRDAALTESEVARVPLAVLLTVIRLDDPPRFLLTSSIFPIFGRSIR